jgi:Mg-chelatase subunit ChlD
MKTLTSPQLLRYAWLLFIVLIGVGAINLTAKAQSNQILLLPAISSDIVCSEPTEVGAKYTITVTGTYSMWPQYSGYGVDAAFVYDVPAEEINALRWPPQRLLNQDVYVLPHWVGDTLEVPPFTIPGLKFKFRTIDNIGFRINGRPLTFTANGPDMQTHRYQATVIGNGMPICFQILDSAFNMQQGQIVPRYEDNSGELRIVIEREAYLSICDADVICNDKMITGISVSAALLKYTDEYRGQPQNTLNAASQIALALDGQFICPDSIVCNSRTDKCIAAALVLDRSGSMEFDFPGSSSRMEALRQSARSFLDKFGECDKAALVTFSSDVTLDVNWTQNTTIVKQALQSMLPNGNTAVYDAALLGIQLAASEYNPNKAVILFTDGADNASSSSEDDVVRLAQKERVPVFVISAALNDDIARNSMMSIAARTGGRYFDAKDAQALDSIFLSISGALTDEQCCTIYFNLPDSIRNNPGPHSLHILAFDADKNIHAEKVAIEIPVDCSLVSSVKEHIDVTTFAQGNARIIPNPTSSTTAMHLELLSTAQVEVQISDILGRTIQHYPAQMYGTGIHIIELPVEREPAGSYFVVLKINGIEQKGLLLVRL